MIKTVWCFSFKRKNLPAAEKFYSTNKYQFCSFEDLIGGTWEKKNYKQAKHEFRSFEDD